MKQSECQSSKEGIREHRLKIRQNLSLDIDNHLKKTSQNFFNSNNLSLNGKSETKLNVLNKIGIVEKEYSQGGFEDTYELKQKVGEGAHASVYRCIQKFTGKQFAVKITKHSDEELIESSNVQFKILKNLDHSNIMRAMTFYTDKLKMTTYLVCELYSYPQLNVHFRNKIISQDQAINIITQILQTIQYLHKNGVCHRDIKPQNILYNPKTRQVKVIDFDCAAEKKSFNSKFEMWTKTGSLHYQAPEIFTSTIYDEKIDLWATGVIAYELITGNLPFKSSYYGRMVKMITECEIQFDLLNVSDGFKCLLKKLLQKDPSKRCSANECLRMPIIQKKKAIQKQKAFDDFEVGFPSSNLTSSNPQIRLSLHKEKNEEDSPSPLLKCMLLINQI